MGTCCGLFDSPFGQLRPPAVHLNLSTKLCSCLGYPHLTCSAHMLGFGSRCCNSQTLKSSQTVITQTMLPQLSTQKQTKPFYNTLFHTVNCLTKQVCKHKTSRISYKNFARDKICYTPKYLESEHLMSLFLFHIQHDLQSSQNYIHTCHKMDNIS